jgi:hypothetical protein
MSENERGLLKLTIKPKPPMQELYYIRKQKMVISEYDVHGAKPARRILIEEFPQEPKK